MNNGQARVNVGRTRSYTIAKVARSRVQRGNRAVSGELASWRGANERHEGGRIELRGSRREASAQGDGGAVFVGVYDGNKFDLLVPPAIRKTNAPNHFSFSPSASGLRIPVLPPRSASLTLDSFEFGMRSTSRVTQTQRALRVLVNLQRNNFACIRHGTR